jgi:small subunit ribosomal protein S8
LKTTLFRVQSKLLKYDKDTKVNVKDIQRISKPGLRKYSSSSSSIPRILNGLGIAIVSTSKGLMTGKSKTT